MVTQVYTYAKTVPLLNVKNLKIKLFNQEKKSYPSYSNAISSVKFCQLEYIYLFITASVAFWCPFFLPFIMLHLKSQWSLISLTRLSSGGSDHVFHLLLTEGLENKGSWENCWITWKEKLGGCPYRLKGNKKKEGRPKKRNKSPR